MSTKKSQISTNAKSAPKWRHQQIAHKTQQKLQRKLDSVERFRDANASTSLIEASKDPQGIETRRAKGSLAPRTFAQTSVISTGDKGIFVTTDIGREKKGLVELGDLVEEYMERYGLLVNTDYNDPTQKAKPIDTQREANISNKATPEIRIQNDETDSVDTELDIEASIRRELSGLAATAEPRHDSYGSNGDKVRVPPKPFQLITLDIPCVSMLRLHPSWPTYDSLDPVTIVHSLCNEAMISGTMRSRHIRRLSPVSWLGKTLADGLEKCCDIVLTPHFAIESTTGPTTAPNNALELNSSSSSTTATTATSNPPSDSRGGTTFAIRPTMRNNGRLSRDTIIQYTADRVSKLGTLGGKPMHKVDLKTYEKGILIEVYRGWIGMSVVQGRHCPPPVTPLSSTLSEVDDDADVKVNNNNNNKNKKTNEALSFEYGYEELKRFNLAEVYIEALKRKEEKFQKG